MGVQCLHEISNYMWSCVISGPQICFNLNANQTLRKGWDLSRILELDNEMT